MTRTESWHCATEAKAHKAGRNEVSFRTAEGIVSRYEVENRTIAGRFGQPLADFVVIILEG